MDDYKRLFAAFAPIIVIFSLIPAQASEISVCPEGCIWGSIQSAIDSASLGDMIAVESGLYHENLINGKALMLQGQSSDGGAPILTGTITAAANGGSISGFEIAGFGGADIGCILNIVGEIAVYLNNIPESKSICSGSSGLWNSSSAITYQFQSRVFRSRMGNYWADYSGEDRNGDGIGDQPKIIDENNVDYYPLIQPIESYRISTMSITGKEGERVELIRAKVNEPFTIQLNSNPTTGYKWFVDYDYNLLGLEDEMYEKNPSKLLGAGGRSVFAFKPLKSGRTAISFVYRRPWENIASEVRKFNVEIDA